MGRRVQTIFSNTILIFSKLKDSYEILKDGKARKQFDDLLRAKRDRTTKRKFRNDAKREKMMSDLERAEKEEEERIWKKLREEIAEFRANHKRKQEEELASMNAKRRAAAYAAALEGRERRWAVEES
ncbi:PREDICTED: eukaryotic translation initiation factor 3 subunit A-like [Ipomoea nil]|uniref:eukaryotic translation initiation factor 3 subunit A-like n=1 Tax=Ipomoea nil TaxID=35883 RepID=UPI000901D359|nr:PREDICTED: eukaryotic translation initiation factor 3 subunit A-like [Ipomoea nil]